MGFVNAIDHAVGNTRYAHLGNSHVPAVPRLKLVVLTCMDTRIDVFKLFGLQPGDAQVVRNAGGRATDDAVRSIALSQAFLGTEEVLVLHHTGCALRERTEAEVLAELERIGGAAPPFAIGTFDDDEAAIREDVEALRGCRFLPRRDRIRGFLYDIGRGAVSEVT